MLYARPSEAMSDLDPPTGFHSRNIIHFLFASLRPSFRLSDVVSVAAAFLLRPSERLLQIFLVTTKVALLSTTYRNAQRNLRSPWRHFLLASLRFYPAPCRDRLDVERACECPLQPLPPPPLLSSSPPRPSHIRPLPQVFHFCHQQRQPRRRLRMEGRSSMFGWTSSLPWIYTMGGREYRDDRPFSLSLSYSLFPPRRPSLKRRATRSVPS